MEVDVVGHCGCVGWVDDVVEVYVVRVVMWLLRWLYVVMCSCLSGHVVMHGTVVVVWLRVVVMEVLA